MLISPQSRQDLCAPALPGLSEAHTKGLFVTIFAWHYHMFSIAVICSRSHTFSFMVLWFFFVFFKNCFRLPEDMYSVMKMTCRQMWKHEHKGGILEGF